MVGGGDTIEWTEKTVEKLLRDYRERTYRKSVTGKEDVVLASLERCLKNLLSYENELLTGHLLGVDADGLLGTLPDPSGPAINDLETQSSLLEEQETALEARVKALEDALEELQSDEPMEGD